VRAISLVRFKALCNGHPRRGFTLLELAIVLAVLAVLAGLVIPLLNENGDNAARVSADASLAALRGAFSGDAGGPGLYADVRHAFPAGFNSYSLRTSHLLASQLDAGTAFAPYALETRKGWRGPYVRGGNAILNTRSNAANVYPLPTDTRNSNDTTFAARGFFPGGSSLFGAPGEPAIGDAWGNPVVLQIPLSAPDGTAFASPEAAWRFARIVSAGPNGVLDTVLNGVHQEALAGKLADHSAAARGDDVVLYLNRADIHE
jgi:prepilin-type N-terminal cleavage/methylation domain-containing protein